MKKKTNSTRTKDSTKKSKNEELKELKSIKKLLILQLLKSGVKGESIAKFLGMQSSNFSRDFPARDLLKE